jgi:hypothetical protein
VIAKAFTTDASLVVKTPNRFYGGSGHNSLEPGRIPVRFRGRVSNADFSFLELGQLRADAIDFCIELVDAAIKTDNVVFCRHCGFDVGDVGCNGGKSAFDHFAEFVERGLLCGHITGSIACRSDGARGCRLTLCLHHFPW